MNNEETNLPPKPLIIGCILYNFNTTSIYIWLVVLNAANPLFAILTVIWCKPDSTLVDVHSIIVEVAFCILHSSSPINTSIASDIDVDVGENPVPFILKKVVPFSSSE